MHRTDLLKLCDLRRRVDLHAAARRNRDVRRRRFKGEREGGEGCHGAGERHARVVVCVCSPQHANAALRDPDRSFTAGWSLKSMRLVRYASSSTIEYSKLLFTIYVFRLLMVVKTFADD